MRQSIAARLNEMAKGYLSLWKKLSGWRFYLFYIAHYTLLFCILQRFVFAAFYSTQRSFVWNVDGLAQHYPRLIYIRQIFWESIRELLAGKGWHLPLYDFRNGPALMDTQMGLPQAFAALWPFESLETFYGLYALGNYYWMGIAFSLFGFYWKQKPLPVMTAAISYAFSGKALHVGLRHPHFAVAMVLLPLLLIGAEQVLRGRRAYTLIVSVYLSLTMQWGVYFSCMQAIFVLLYVTVRFFDIVESDRARQALRLTGRFLVWGGIPILLAAPSWLPALIHIAGAGRVGNASTMLDNMLYYGRSYYAKFFGQFIVNPDTAGRKTYLGFSVLTLPAVVLLFARLKRKERSLRVLFALLSVMLWIPQIGYIMSGFSNVGNRFVFGYAFVAAAILMFMLPKLFTMSRREGILTCVGVALYFALAYMGARVDYYDVRPILFLLAAVVLLGVCYAMGKRGGKLMIAALLITCVSVSYSAFLRFDEREGGYIADFFFSVDWRLDQGQYAAMAQSDAVAEDDGFFRVTGDSISNVEANLAPRYGLNGLSMYPYYGWSDAYVKWVTELELPRYDNKHYLYGRTINAPVLALSGVKYYASRQKALKPRPYGFVEVDSVKGANATDAILQNEHALPVGYTYDQYMTREVYDALNGMGKQEAQLCAVLLEEKPSVSGVTAAAPEPTAQRVPCEVVKTDGLSWNDGVLTVEKEKATLTLAFEGLPETETYVRIVGHDLIEGYYRTFWVINVNCGDMSAQPIFFSDRDTYSTGEKTQSIDFGYSEEGLTSVTITFPKVGLWRLEDVEIWCQPMDGFAGQVELLGKETLQNVVTDWHSLRGDITVDGDRMLLLAVPYANGWAAYVDGQRTQLYQANTAFMAVGLSAGRHEVELRYSMPGLNAGLAMCAAGIASLIVLILYCRRAKKSAAL